MSLLFLFDFFSFFKDALFVCINAIWGEEQSGCIAETDDDFIFNETWKHPICILFYAFDFNNNDDIDGTCMPLYTFVCNYDILDWDNSL